VRERGPQGSLREAPRAARRWWSPVVACFCVVVFVGLFLGDDAKGKDDDDDEDNDDAPTTTTTKMQRIE
jgi:hypothetical protein